jgi:hypothetical protein
MRKTISLDDELGRRLLAAARERGQSLSAFLAEAGRLHLEQPPRAVVPFELISRGGRGPRTGVDLDRTSELLVADDERDYRR